MVRAIYNMAKHGATIAPPSINDSGISFTPQEATNTILFGLGGISGINNDIAREIISLRPFKSFKQFLHKVNQQENTLIKPAKIIKLIKGGCFDAIEADRTKVMDEYIHSIAHQKEKLDLSNAASFMRECADTLDQHLSYKVAQAYRMKTQIICKEQFYKKDDKFKSKKHYIVPEQYEDFITQHLTEDKDFYYNENDQVIVIDKALEKVLKPYLAQLVDYMNQPETLALYNQAIYNNTYLSKVKNTDINKWSFEATSFYHYQGHELEGVDYEKYNLVDYTTLPVEPSFTERQWGNRTYHRYDLCKICGTVVDRNDNKHLIYLLTPELEVVTVKFYSQQYANFKRVISDEQGVIDPSWFSRGELLMISGYRQEDMFKVKRYLNSLYQYEVVRIIAVHEDKSLELQLDREWARPMEGGGTNGAREIN